MRGFRVWNERERTYDDGWDYLLSSDGSLYALKYGALVSMGGADYLTVELDTGLKDINGVEICEGDILEDGEGYPVEYWTVKFEDGKFIGSTQGVSEDIFELTDLEVVGHIHENRELLEDINVLNKEGECS